MLEMVSRRLKTGLGRLFECRCKRGNLCQSLQSKNSFTAARKWEQYTLNEMKRLQAIEARNDALSEQTRKTWNRMQIIWNLSAVI